ncbi:YqgE/AlgH family protein [Anatilimnocola floriformis]|uniref:YqgE/AlgH family protein n=1 Tax=Anatilimnocola floriformis TaxID=2948575 RepID=UPI0020C398F7|nr:YqgE/AlgH family protein [Anatilimnocola floriformis]
MKSLQGKLLVASPHLGDGNFFRSVVLLVKHDSEGAFGLILNRPLNSTLQEVWTAIQDEATESDSDDEEVPPPENPLDELQHGEQPIYVGGPVEGPLVVVHGLKKYAEAQVQNGVYFAAHKDYIRKVITQAKKPFRVFSGYAGWGAGQLEGELQAGGWLLTEANKDLIFYKDDDLWEQVVQGIAEQILSPAAETKHIPPDASLN